MKILLTGGIGDCLVLESTGQFDQVQEIYWACRAQAQVQPLIEQLYPHITHQTVYDKFNGNLRCFVTGNDAEKYLSERIPRDVIDWSICLKFREQLPFVGSRTLTTALAPVDKPKGRFYVIQSDTTDNDANHRATRQLDDRDWQAVIDILDEKRARGIVLGSLGSQPAPQHKRLIDMQGKTTIAESIELLKGARGFLGIDSFLSVLASQLFDKDHLMVRCNNNHGYMWRRLYWKPHNEFEWLKKSFWKSEPLTNDMQHDVMKLQLRLKVPRLFLGENLPAGAIVELNETLANLWIRNGLAELVQEPVKAAPKPVVERAVKKVQAKKAVTLQ